MLQQKNFSAAVCTDKHRQHASNGDTVRNWKLAPAKHHSMKIKIKTVASYVSFLPNKKFTSHLDLMF